MENLGLTKTTTAALPSSFHELKEMKIKKIKKKHQEGYFNHPVWVTLLILSNKCETPWHSNVKVWHRSVCLCVGGVWGVWGGFTKVTAHENGVKQFIDFGVFAQ